MKRKIILIDDDPEILEWVKTGLSKEEIFEVFTSDNLEDGWGLVQKEKPDLVLIDLKLPDGDGFELSRLIKHNFETAEISVILITGVYKELEYKEKGYAVGADDFIVKPFSFEQLLARINRQFRKKDLV